MCSRSTVHGTQLNASVTAAADRPLCNRACVAAVVQRGRSMRHCLLRCSNVAPAVSVSVVSAVCRPAARVYPTKAAHRDRPCHTWVKRCYREGLGHCGRCSVAAGQAGSCTTAACCPTPLSPLHSSFPPTGACRHLLRSPALERDRSTLVCHVVASRATRR